MTTPPWLASSRLWSCFWWNGPVGLKHRRRLEIEAKAKFVASVWGADFVQFLAALVVLPELPRSIWKKRMNSTDSSKPTEAKQLEWQGIEQNLPPNRPDDLCLSFSLHPSSMVWNLYPVLSAISRVVGGCFRRDGTVRWRSNVWALNLARQRWNQASCDFYVLENQYVGVALYCNTGPGHVVTEINCVNSI